MDVRYPNETVSDRIMESQVLCGMFDNPRQLNGFIDLRPYADDKTVIKNPHKGWFWHFIDNGLARGAYRDHNEPGDYMEDFPGLCNLYLRFDWSDVEKEEGVYDFTPLDSIMEEWGSKGYTFSMRACTFEGDNPIQATPLYVFEKGAKCYRLPGGGLQPDFGDPYYLERLDAFLKVLGEKYNNDPRIDIFDIGTYGTWGEGHTVEGDGVIYPMSVVRKHIDMHLKYFPDKKLLINDDIIVGRTPHGQAECQEIMDYAYERGLGVQDDSICCDYYSIMNGYDTMRAPWAFRKLSENCPSCIEFAHYTYIRPQFDDYYRNGYTIIECLKNSRATYAGFHGYPRDWLKNERWLGEYCANRLGYWYFCECAVVPELAASAHNIIKLTFRNKGWSKAYDPKKIRLMVKGDSYCKIIDTDADLESLMSEEAAEYTLKLDLRDILPGTYGLYIGVSENGTPIRLALKDEIRDGDFYKIKEFTI